jgi:hypothetical protein
MTTETTNLRSTIEMQIIEARALIAAKRADGESVEYQIGYLDALHWMMEQTADGSEDDEREVEERPEDANLEERLAEAARNA